MFALPAGVNASRAFTNVGKAYHAKPQPAINRGNAVSKKAKLYRRSFFFKPGVINAQRFQSQNGLEIIKPRNMEICILKSKAETTELKLIVALMPLALASSTTGL